MARMTTTPEPPSRDRAARAACVQRLATALSGYHDLEVTARVDGPAPCLAVRNTAVPCLSETVSVSRMGNDLAYVWSWGERIADSSHPDTAALAVAYVLAASDAHLRPARRSA